MAKIIFPHPDRSLMPADMCVTYNPPGKTAPAFHAGAGLMRSRSARRQKQTFSHYMKIAQGA